MNVSNDDIPRRLFLELTAKGVLSASFLGMTGCVLFNQPTYAEGAISYAKLPRWRGFNLVEKVTLARNRVYEEWDFDVIKEWGFDFVRLPLDYRIWTKKPGIYDEKQLKDIDQAVNWARCRGIHVNICLHRAPGYCVNPPKDDLDLWDDGHSGDKARIQFAAQWSMFAERYQGIPSTELSFNLINEPPKLKKFQYFRVATSGVDAIRKADRNRLIIADGLDWGTLAATELVNLKIAQSLHGYKPVELTFYKTLFMKNSEKWLVPNWPLTASLTCFLYGDEKPEFKSSLILKGKFLKDAQVIIKVQRVSAYAQLLVRANARTIKEYTFKPSAGNGEWKESSFHPDGNYYLATYDKEYRTILPENTLEIEIVVGKGDWLDFSEIRIEPFLGLNDNTLSLTPNNSVWGQRQKSYLVDNKGKVTAEGPASCDKDILLKTETMQWKNLETLGVGIHVGEWGANQSAPHDSTLAWMKDRLTIWKQVGWGWALWQLRGPFGVLDSERSDVVYENYKGHKLDRKMLELLKQG